MNAVMMMMMMTMMMMMMALLHSMETEVVGPWSTFACINVDRCSVGYVYG